MCAAKTDLSTRGHVTYTSADDWLLKIIVHQSSTSNTYFKK